MLFSAKNKSKREKRFYGRLFVVFVFVFLAPVVEFKLQETAVEGAVEEGYLL